MKRTLALAVALLIAVAACGSSDVDEDAFRKGLSDRTDLTKSEVDCVVDKTFDTFDQSAINDLYTAADRKDVADSDEQQFEKIVKDCVDK